MVLSRKVGEVVEIDNGRVLVTVLGVEGRKVRLGFLSSDGAKILRREVADAIRAEEVEKRST